VINYPQILLITLKYIYISITKTAYNGKKQQYKTAIGIILKTPKNGKRQNSKTAKLQAHNHYPRVA
jgi:hypothetical protein